MERKICRVINCQNTTNLYQSPNIKHLLRQWQIALNTSETLFYVCEQHFPKKDFIVKKVIKTSAIPCLNLAQEKIKVEDNRCGFCLVDPDVAFVIQKELKDIFIDTTGCEPLTSYMCKKCKTTLEFFKKFKNEINQMPVVVKISETPRKKETGEDCVIICDDSSDDDDIKNIKTETKRTTFKRESTKSKIKDDDFSSAPNSPLNNSFDNKESDTDMLVSCKYCFTEKMVKKELEQHVKDCHPANTKTFLCHVCSRAFTRMVALKQHLHTHEIKRFYVCDLCDMKCIKKADLRQHMGATHTSFATRLEQRKMVCEICEQKFRVRTKLQRHLNKCHVDGYDCGNRVNKLTNFFDCQGCGATYPNLFSLRRHKCEKGKFQIRCNLCQAPAASFERLKIHLEWCKTKKKFGC